VGAARSGGGDAAADVARADNGLTVEALGRAGDQMIATGRLALIDNQINQSTATIRLKAIFANPERTLWPNQFVKARLRLGVRRGVLVVPAASIQRGPQGTFVYVVGDDSKAAVRPVEVDAIEGDAAILKESAHGVAPGDRVVSEGQNQLRPGARVDAREPGGVAGAPAPDGGGGPGGGAHGRGGNGGSGPRGHGQGNGRPPQEKPAP
jgi:multidrug efflux system membrane fusion protein